MKTTPAFDAYWRFAAERQRIFIKRVKGKDPPWADDPIIASNKFTNTFRASDRVSQYLIRKVIYGQDLDDSAQELVFRILLFKLFNSIETWKLLSEEFGTPTWDSFDIKSYGGVLANARGRGDTIYSALPTSWLRHQDLSSMWDTSFCLSE